jgi:hypothetical protein
MEAWFKESQGQVSPSYKKPGTLIAQPIGDDKPVVRTLLGVFPTTRKLPDFEMKNEGEMAEVEWTLSADDIL